MRNTETYNREILQIEPSTIVCLYNINLRDRGRYLFHAGENGYHKEIIFNGQKYDYFPIKAEGFNMSGDGKLPRPKMTFPNHQGNVSLRLGVFKDFINYKVTRIKTFVKYLDAENFPNEINPHAEPDPDTSFSEDIFFVNQKTKENDNVVEFELVSLLELQNASVPARTMYSNYCGWQYRSDIGCGYRGRPISDQKNKRFVPSGYTGQMVGEETYFSGDFLQENDFALNSSHLYPKWTRSGKYNKGDVVRVDMVDNDLEIDRKLYPVNIYVCLEDNVRSNPIGDTERWVLDDCDKTLCGCRLRFSELATGAGGGKRMNAQNIDAFTSIEWTESGNGLPYGGFPGIDPYEYK
mgnify:CR=1 FL=1|tara:strand:- start:25675 stop:26727 length:1053 start_codon:yes stop_codon:yes gene_type:complete